MNDYPGEEHIMISHLKPRISGRSFLFILLSVASITIAFSTWQNIRSVQSLADHALASTALSLAFSAEEVVRGHNDFGMDTISEVFADRVVAYALIADRNGKVLFHTNPRLTGTTLAGAAFDNHELPPSQTGKRITLQTGLPAYEFNYILHTKEGAARLLRIVLHTIAADRIVSEATNRWWPVIAVLALLWTTGGLFYATLSRSVRLQRDLQSREQMALIGQMTSVLAHEIRNALGSIKGYTQWVHEKMDPEDPKREGLEKTLKGIGRIEKLAQELLMYSREEEYKKEAVDISSLVKGTIDLMPLWNGKIDIHADGRMPAITDIEKTRRILINCFQNSMEAMDMNGTINITVEKKGSVIRIVVEDTGHGISEDDLGRIFSPFFTTKTTGTGLGLAYSKKLVEGMEGSIEIRNRTQGSGARVVISLPAAKG